MGTVVAGTTVGLEEDLPIAQSGVPINFTIASSDPATPYTGAFSNGLSWIVVTTNVHGVADANFTADTTGTTLAAGCVPAGSDDCATAQSIVSEPITTLTTNTDVSPITGNIQTIAAAGTTLKILTYQDVALAIPTTYTKASGHLYLDIKLQDQYGNSVPWGSAFALQVTLSTTAGGLSATTVYITQGMVDTFASNYQVQYTAPSTLGTQTLSATTSQSGVATGTKTVHVVSLAPSVYITSPSTTALTVNSQTIAGYGFPSPGAAAGTVVTSFKYSLNGAGNLTRPVTSTNSSGASFFSFSVNLLNGSNTLKVFATDSNGNIGVGTITLVVSHGPAVVGQTFVVPSGQSPKLVTVSGFTGVNATFMNTGTRTFSGQVWFELLNSNNQVVQGPTFVQSSFTAGNTQTFFFALSPGLASGSYTAKLFVVVAGQAYSASYTAPVTVS